MVKLRQVEQEQQRTFEKYQNEMKNTVNKMQAVIDALTVEKEQLAYQLQKASVPSVDHVRGYHLLTTSARCRTPTTAGGVGRGHHHSQESTGFVRNRETQFASGSTTIRVEIKSDHRETSP